MLKIVLDSNFYYGVPIKLNLKIVNSSVYQSTEPTYSGLLSLQTAGQKKP
jgi:hypothetical protein